MNNLQMLLKSEYFKKANFQTVSKYPCKMTNQFQVKLRIFCNDMYLHFAFVWPQLTMMIISYGTTW